MRIGTYLEKGNGWQEPFMQAEGYKGTAGMLFIGNPKSYNKPKVSIGEAQLIKELLDRGSMRELIIHASFIGNLCSPDIAVRSKTVNMIVQELNNADLIGASSVCIHPGSAVGNPTNQAIKRLADSIAEIIVKTSNVQTKLLIETMAGKGTEVFDRMEHWLAIMDYFHSCPNRVGLCLDTCHNSDAGYELDSEDRIVEFVGLLNKVDIQKRVHCIHLNGSLNPCGSHKDRHAQLIDGNSFFTMEHAKTLLQQPGWNADLIGIIECWNSKQERNNMCNELATIFER